MGALSGRLAVASAFFFVLACAYAQAATGPEIRVENDASVPPAQLDSILRDFRAWGARVYAFNHAVPDAPVKLKLTHAVPFGFNVGDTVELPPSDDRAAMIEDWVHELTHHVTGHESSFFFKEGIATRTLDALFAEDGRVPQGWPNYGHSSDAWVALYQARGAGLPLADALAWPGYRGDSPEHDFRSWQVYNIASSFVGWYITRDGYDAFRAAFAKQWPAEDSAALEREWLAALRARKLAPFDAAAALPQGRRYRYYAGRLAPR